MKNQWFVVALTLSGISGLGCDPDGAQGDDTVAADDDNGKSDGFGRCADPAAIQTPDDAWACFSADYGVYESSDWTKSAIYAGSGSVDYIACVDGVVYGTAGAVTALGVGALWGGAILEPTPGGEIVATIGSAPLLGFLGGVVGVKLSGSVDDCVVPLAQIGVTAAANGYDWVMRGLQGLVSQVFEASGTREAQRKLKQLARNTGADEHCLSDALHDCKSMYPGDYNVDIDTRTGRVTDPRTGEEICNLLDICL